MRRTAKRRSDDVTVCFNCERLSHGTRSTPNVCHVCGEELVTMSRSEYVERMEEAK